jgi:ubiquinone/menaquinone biosynthesis C-methylase UbiE
MAMKTLLDSYNKQTYMASDIVRYYSEQCKLFASEQTILNILKIKLPDMRMLDIGVGGGRTTLHFMNLVKEYVGIDFSYNMIKACRDKYSKELHNISFKLCDVRSMDIFADNIFDIILFSFNGLDYIQNNDRMTALREIRRVAKHGSYFCFSSHNILSVKALYKYRLRYNILIELWRLLIILALNGNYKKIINKDYAMINDGAHRYRLTTYYVNPFYQVNQLKTLGFNNVRLFSLTGNEIDKKSTEINDQWIYYLCEVDKDK